MLMMTVELTLKTQGNYITRLFVSTGIHGVLQELSLHGREQRHVRIRVGLCREQSHLHQSEGDTHCHVLPVEEDQGGGQALHD